MKHINKGLSLLYIFIIGVLGVATFVEQAQGSAYSARYVYHTWWFFALWALLFVVACVVMARQSLWQRRAVFMLHVSMGVILLGAATSFITSSEGTLHLRQGKSATHYTLTEGGGRAQLPFRQLTLQSFSVECYPGTQAPQDFVSHVTFTTREGRVEKRVISMNNILTFQGYRFYQSSFDSDLHGSILSVGYDPWGTPITYLGYLLLAVSVVMVLVAKGETFRRLLRSPLLREGALVLVLLFCAAPFSGLEARSLPTLNRDKAERLARMPVVYNDRVAPLSTLAHDFLTKLYGSSTYHGLTAEQVVYGWLKRPDVWKTEPMLKVKDAELRRQLGVEGKYVRLADLFDIYGQYKLQPIIQGGHETKAVRELDEKVGIILMLTEGQLIKPAHGADVSRLEAEVFYNEHPVNMPLAMGCLTLGVLTLVVLAVPGLKHRRWLLRGGWVLLAVATFVLGASYVLRWYVSGRVPLGNGYETMLFMSLSVMVVALAVSRRMAVVLPFGFLLAGFTLLVSFLSMMNPQITPLMPVLQSPLLSIHVSVVMMAYSLLAFTMLCGVAVLALGNRADARLSDTLTLLSRLMLYPAVFLLAVGIFLGAVWANVSWGKYWGWDPKEVWALITLMVYAVPLHRSVFLGAMKTRAYHLYMVLAFLSVLMTYFGVNYFLGGMHSYA